jgi:hypothetical protein
MSRGKRKKRGGDGIGPWWLVIVAATIFVGIPLMIYESVAGFISRRIPGGRERQAKAELKRIDKDAEGARKLAKGLAADLPEIDAKLIKSADRSRRKIERHLAEGGWAEDLDLDGGLWGRALDLLIKADRVAVLDWKSAPDEVEEALTPLLQRYGVAVDWSFAAELEEAEDWEALKTDNFTENASERVAALGHVVVKIFDSSDGFQLAVCTPAEFALIDGLSDASGDYSVGKA